MKNFIKLILVFSVFILSGCPDSVQPVKSDYSGSVFKGPFLVGSTVTIYELDSGLNQTGRAFSSTIVSNDGTYNIENIPVSGNIEIVADGFFFDEITGKITSERMTMRTITDKTGTVNINLFSVLQYDRVKQLFSEGKTLSEAKKQSITELLSIFGFQNLDESADEISLTSPNAPALLAVSSMFTNSEFEQDKSRSISQIEEMITIFRTDFIDCTVSTEIIEKLEKSAIYVKPDSVKNHLQTYFNGKNISVVVPDFAIEMNNFITKRIADNDFSVLSESFSFKNTPATIEINEGSSQDFKIINNGATITIESLDDQYNLIEFFSVSNCSVVGNKITIGENGYCAFGFSTKYDKYTEYGEHEGSRTQTLKITTNGVSRLITVTVIDNLNE